MPSASSSLPFEYNDFHGGLNVRDAPELLSDSEAQEIMNVQGAVAGAIVKRRGLRRVAVTNLCSSLYGSEVAYAPLAPQTLIGATSANVIIAISPAGALATLTTFSGSPYWDFVSAPSVAGQGPVYFLNGQDTPQGWNGAAGPSGPWTNATGSVAVPNGRFITYSNNQVLISGVTGNPSRVYWSAIGDPTNWDPASLTGAGFMDFDPTDGQNITGLGRVGSYVLVCKPRKLYLLIDTATATARRLSDNIGCIAHRSIATGAEGTYFLSEDRGVFVTNGSKLTPISDKIQPIFDSAYGGLTSAAGVYCNAHYYLSIPLNNWGFGTQANDVTLDYDAVLGSWWKHSFGAADFALLHQQLAPSQPPLQLYSATALVQASTFASATQPQSVDQAFTPGVYTDQGSPFAWKWVGPWQSPTFYRRRRFPTPWFRKRLRQIRYSGLGQVDLSIIKDFATSGVTLIGADVFGNSTRILERRSFGQGVMNAWALQFSGVYSTPAEVTSYTLMVTDRKDLVVG